jgi:hypothetical protein
VAEFPLDPRSGVAPYLRIVLQIVRKCAADQTDAAIEALFRTTFRDTADEER